MPSLHCSLRAGATAPAAKTPRKELYYYSAYCMTERSNPAMLPPRESSSADMPFFSLTGRRILPGKDGGAPCLRAERPHQRGPVFERPAYSSQFSSRNSTRARASQRVGS